MIAHAYVVMIKLDAEICELAIRYCTRPVVSRTGTSMPKKLNGAAHSAEMGGNPACSPDFQDLVRRSGFPASRCSTAVPV